MWSPSSWVSTRNRSDRTPAQRKNGTTALSPASYRGERAPASTSHQPSSNPSAIGREYRVVRRGNLINVFGGKMTTFMALARRVSMRVDNYFGHSRAARAIAEEYFSSEKVLALMLDRLGL